MQNVGVTKNGFREYLQEKAIRSRKRFPWVAGAAVMLFAASIASVWFSESFPVVAIVGAALCAIFTSWAIHLWIGINPDYQKADALMERIEAARHRHN